MTNATLLRRLVAIESKITPPDDEYAVWDGCRVEPAMSWGELVRHIAANGKRLVDAGGLHVARAGV